MNQRAFQRIERILQLNHDLGVETLAACRLPRLTIDVGGTVVCTGAKVLPSVLLGRGCLRKAFVQEGEAPGRADFV